MILQKSGVVVVALLLIGAVTASSSSAALETKAAEWYTGASPGATLAEQLPVVTKIAEHPSLGAKISISLNLFFEPLQMTATGINCIGCIIENREATSKSGKVAYGRGKLEFTGMTVDEPSGCTVSSQSGVANTIITKELTFHGDWMDTNAANQKAFIDFFPSVPSTFFQFKLAGSGPTCESVAGTWNTPGSLFAESANNTGVFAVNQNLIFSSFITGTVAFSLVKGAQFAIK